MHIDLNILNLDQISVDYNKKDIETCKTINLGSADIDKTYAVCHVTCMYND